MCLETRQPLARNKKKIFLTKKKSPYTITMTIYVMLCCRYVDRSDVFSEPVGHAEKGMVGRSSEKNHFSNRLDRKSPRNVSRRTD